MELIAVVEALKEIIKKCNKYKAFEIFSDSAYVVNSFKNGWMYNWKSNGWKTKNGRDVKNVDLWKQSIKLLGLISNRNPECEIIFTKIKGHSGITYNEIVDKLGYDDTGIAADIMADHQGFEFASINDWHLRAADTGEILSQEGSSMNFRIYWDGSLQDNLADGGMGRTNREGYYVGNARPYTIKAWNGNGFTTVATMNQHSCNGTKQTPNLSCDLLGDWREEVILHDGDDNLYIYSSPMPTDYNVPCLMTDHIYRMGIVWQQTAYNQPPHLGYRLADRAVDTRSNKK